MKSLLVSVLLLATAGSVVAGEIVEDLPTVSSSEPPPPTDPSGRLASLHVGLDFRTDLGTHHTRVPIGYRWCVWDTTVVVDPLAILDGQHDFDLIVERFLGPRIGLLGGYRWSAVAVADGMHHQQRTMVGVTALGPTFWDDALRTKFSFEIATLWVKHGGGTETAWISADRNLLDHFSTGLFLRVEYARGL